MSFSLKDALAGGGAAITVAAFLLGNLTGEQVQPVDNIVPNSPAAEVRNPCPSGWDFTDSSDLHIRVLSCDRGEWTVFLLPDGTFNYGWDGKAPAFETDPKKVPGWP